MYRSLGQVGSHVVEQERSTRVSRKVMLQRKHLAAVAHRRLGQEANFRQAIHYGAGRPGLLDQVEHRPCRLTKLEVGRVKQALLAALVQQPVRKAEFCDGDPVEIPVMRHSACPQLFLCFREGDVERSLSGPPSLHEELHGHRRLSGTRISFEKINAVARNPTFEDSVKTGDAEPGLAAPLWCSLGHQQTCSTNHPTR